MRDVPSACDDRTDSGLVSRPLEARKCLVEIVDLETQMIKFVPFPKGTRNRTVVRVPAELKLVLAVRTQEVRELSLVPGGGHPRLQPHPKDVCEELNGRVKIPYTQARVREAEPHKPVMRPPRFSLVSDL